MKVEIQGKLLKFKKHVLLASIALIGGMHNTFASPCQHGSSCPYASSHTFRKPCPYAKVLGAEQQVVEPQVVEPRGVDSLVGIPWGGKSRREAVDSFLCSETRGEWKGQYVSDKPLSYFGFSSLRFALPGEKECYYGVAIQVEGKNYFGRLIKDDVPSEIPYIDLKKDYYLKNLQGGDFWGWAYTKENLEDGSFMLRVMNQNNGNFYTATLKLTETFSADYQWQKVKLQKVSRNSRE